MRTWRWALSGALLFALVGLSIAGPDKGKRSEGLGESSPFSKIYRADPSYESSMMGFFSTGIALADIDGDGGPDLIASNGNDMSPQPLIVHYNSGDADSFGAFPDWYSADIDYSAGLAVGDIDGDGWTDVAVAVPLDLERRPAGGGVKIYMNRGGALERAPSLEIRAGFSVAGLAFGDVDADGRLDLIVPTFVDGAGGSKGEAVLARIYANRGGHLDTTPAWLAAESLTASDAIAADINQDGWMDVAFSSEKTTAFFGKPRTGQTFPLPERAGWSSRQGRPFSYSIDAGRVTGSDLSLVISEDCGAAMPCADSRFVMYRPAVGVDPVWISNRAEHASHVLLADLDADGLLDLLASQWGADESDGGKLWWFRGAQAGFARQPDFTSSSGLGRAVGEGLAVADLRSRGIVRKLATFRVERRRSVFTLPERRVTRIVSVALDGEELPRDRYAWTPTDNWVSLHPLSPGQVLSVAYTASPVQDVGEATWNPDRGNLIFYSFIEDKMIHEPNVLAVSSSEPGGRSP